MQGIAVGVSGGVDSAVSAARLIKMGYKVTGVYLDVCGAENGADKARAVCRALGIPFVEVNARAELENLVVTPFIDSYCSGLTPIPCVFCNPMVKYPMLLKAADELGAEKVATGHYAGVTEIDGEFFLRQGDAERDQSYMLYRLPPETLKRCLFPIGDTPKHAVRDEAAALGLPVAEAPDSMEICFVPDNDYASFIGARGHSMPEGDIADENGRVLGRHRGLHGYTVGQRRGLGIPGTERMYVTAIDVERNRVVLGSVDSLYKSQIKIRDVINRSRERQAVDVKIRHSRQSYPAVVEGDTVRFTDRPARAPAPGQSAVFYRDGIVLGGGIIC